MEYMKKVKKIVWFIFGLWVMTILWIIKSGCPEKTFILIFVLAAITLTYVLLVLIKPLDMFEKYIKDCLEGELDKKK